MARVNRSPRAINSRCIARLMFMRFWKAGIPKCTENAPCSSPGTLITVIASGEGDPDGPNSILSENESDEKAGDCRSSWNSVSSEVIRQACLISDIVDGVRGAERVNRAVTKSCESG